MKIYMLRTVPGLVLPAAVPNQFRPVACGAYGGGESCSQGSSGET